MALKPTNVNQIFAGGREFWNFRGPGPNFGLISRIQSKPETVIE